MLPTAVRSRRAPSSCSNENINGLLRQYLPNGTDLSIYSQDELNQIALSLNTRPRARHNFRSPLQVYTNIYNWPKHLSASCIRPCCTSTLKPPSDIGERRVGLSSECHLGRSIGEVGKLLQNLGQRFLLNHEAAYSGI